MIGRADARDDDGREALGGEAGGGGRGGGFGGENFAGGVAAFAGGIDAVDGVAGDVREDVAVGGLVDFVGPGEAEGVVEESLEFAAAFADAGEVIEDESAPGGVCVGGVEVVDVLGDDAGVAVCGGDPAGGGEESRMLEFFDGGIALRDAYSRPSGRRGVCPSCREDLCNAQRRGGR